MLYRNWDTVRTGFHWERAWRIQQLARLGVRDMLTGWTPRLRWHGTVLEVPHPRELDIVPMITSHQDGKAVLHTCTPAGLDLLSHRGHPHAPNSV